MSFENIPDEMKSYIQWCVWRYEKTNNDIKPTKVPYNPRTGRHASVSDPQTWCSFVEAFEAAKDTFRWAGIGFIFSSRDPYCGIDLDYSENSDILNRQKQIFETFNSYAEFSPSGRGLHIIIKGSVDHGRKRDAVEIYSRARFFTMTGNVYNNAPINEYNELANKMWEHMAPPKNSNNGFISSITQSYEDQAIYDMASAAANGDKFSRLWNGDWTSYYNSQSEADFALIDILSFYTQFIPQIERLFLSSALGQRDKAKRKAYLHGMIQRSFDNQVAPVDISGIMDSLEAAKAAMALAQEQSAQSLPATGSDRATAEMVNFHIAQGDAFVDPMASPTRLLNLPISQWPQDTWIKYRPPGILSGMVDYILASSPRPIYEISLVASLGLMSGIVARQFNISKTGLNQYLMLIADTGMGKDAIVSGCSRIINGLAEKLNIKDDIIGPAEISSGQALMRHLSDRRVPCFVSLMGEFGIRLRQITDPKLTLGADKTFHRALLDLYSKSGAGVTINPTVYADKAKNTDPLHSPAFSMVGESTREKFYEALNEDNVSSGLLPRFTIVEYNGPRAQPNENHGNVQVPHNLVYQIEQLIIYVQFLADQKTVYDIAINQEANQLLKYINEQCDDFMFASKGDALKQVWNRVHLKILKLAGLLAVSTSSASPQVTAQMVVWATSLILADTHRLLNKFDRGEMGEINEANLQEDYIKSELKKYINGELNHTKGINITLQKVGIASRSFLQQRLNKSKPFRKEKNPTFSFNKAIENLISNGHLARVKNEDLIKYSKSVGYHIIVTDIDWLIG